MWQFEHTITTEAKVETIWSLYSDMSTWTSWDHGIASASLDGPFAPGTKGHLQPKGQQPLPFELTEVLPNRGFSDVTDIAPLGIQVHFTHRLEDVDGRTRITHAVQITGPGAAEMGPKFGAHMVEGIPQTMQGLAALALALDKAGQHAAR